MPTDKHDMPERKELPSGYYLKIAQQLYSLHAPSGEWLADFGEDISLDKLYAFAAAMNPAGCGAELREALAEWKEKMDELPLGHECRARGSSSYNWMNYAYMFFSKALAATPAPRGSAFTA